VCCSCTTGLVLFVILLAIFKAFLKLRIRWDKSATCLVGKTAIVTGANTGIGFYAAQDLAKRGARVILACRNRSRAEEAKTKIIKATENPNILVKILDLASFKSVREFAKEINETEENLHILINNAGVGKTSAQTTEDGLDFLFQTNHLGSFLLTHLLIDLLKKSKWGRIVNVSSMAAHMANLDVENLGVVPKGRFADTVHYSNSKLGNILFTNELARRLRNTCIQANSLHPGVVDTEIFRDLPGFIKPIFTVFAKSLFKTSEEGAQTSIYLAVSKRVEYIAGEFFDNCKIGNMPDIARSEGLSKRLWEKSEEFVKLTAGERRL